MIKKERIKKINSGKTKMRSRGREEEVADLHPS